ncbi:MAG: 4-alpha-glucanotransferase [Myxococcales bacterium]|nr:4-alpha-glucanotransferase [Myxococcales bacterium]
MLPKGRISGILLPVFSLRSRGDFGIGDFGALDGLFAWMEAARQRLLVILPLLPTAPHDTSPYSTRSAFGLNALFIDLSSLPEFAEAGGLEALSAEERGRLAQARSSGSIRYELVFPLKEAALRRSFERFEEKHWRANDGRAEELKGYIAREAAWLEAFTLFAAISKREEQRPWWDWPAKLRDREMAAVEEAKRELQRELLFESWLQWVSERQWESVREQARRRRVLLCGDEPFIIGTNSADAWSHPTLLRRDARLGVPPDDFSATGQDWGLPYFDFPEMEKDDYRWLRFRAHKAASYYDLRRVDHAVGYFRQWIRDEKTPTGRFLPPDEESQRKLGERHFRLLSAEAGIVAEDLGVIPKFVRETLTRLGLPGYRVLRWEKDDGVFRSPHGFPALSLVTTGTHDTDTLREWWEKAPDWEREAVARVYPELAALKLVPKELTPKAHETLLAAAESAGSDLCVLPWQDVFGARERVNLPGSMGDSNWTYRIDLPVEELLSREDTRRAAEFLARLTADGRRDGPAA